MRAVTTWELRAARRYLAAYERQGGTARTVGCAITHAWRYLPDWAFAAVGPEPQSCWVDNGYLAAREVLAVAGEVA